MRVVITGGAGFLGTRLAEALVARGSLADAEGRQQPIEQIVLYDQPDAVGTTDGDPRRLRSDRRRHLQRRRDRPICSANGPVGVFHLASIVSGHGERDFDLALRVNLDGARHLLEACRAS